MADRALREEISQTPQAATRDIRLPQIQVAQSRQHAERVDAIVIHFRPCERETFELL